MATKIIVRHILNMRIEFMLSVRSVVTGAMVLIITVALVSAVTLSYLASERVLLNHAEKLTKRIATDTTTFTENFLDPADDAAALTQRLAQSAIIRTDEPVLLARYFYQIVQTRPDFAGIFYGGANGEFIYVSRDETVDGALYRLKEIRTEPKREVILTFLNAQFEEVARRSDPADEYDPRTRPWYLASNEKGAITWTDPYIFFTSKRPGITVATPVFGNDASIQGAVGIDIRIDALSRFLNKLELSERGGAAVISPNGDIIAHNNPTLVLSSSEDGKPTRFAKFDEVDDIGLAGAAKGLVGGADSELAQLKPKETRGTRFQVGGEYWRGAIRRLRGAQTPWVVVTYLPENDILGPSKRARNLGYIISAIAALLSALAAALFAQSFSKPVRALERQAKMISQGNFEDVEQSPTRIRELEATRTAFRRATHWLRDHSRQNDELNQKLRHSADKLEERIEERTHELSEVNQRLVDTSRRTRTLASELKNRIKEIFAITSTLVAIAARETENTSDMQQEAEKRIHALALAHSATHSIEATDLESLVRSILEPFIERGIEAKISGDAVAVRADLVSPMSMIFYEMATNAVNLGGLNQTGGSLSVNWRRVGTNGLKLYWSERQPAGLIDEAVTESEDRETILLGTMINQLSATLKRELTSDGMDITLAVDELVVDEPDTV